MAQNYSYPPGFSTSVNPSVGTIGSPVPLSGTAIAGRNPSGNLQDVSTDASGNVNVNVVSSSLPTGSATAANQVIQISQFPATLGQKTSAGSTGVVLASDQSAIPVSQSGTWNITNVSGTVSLPTGASTSALQTQISGQLPTTLGAKVTAASVAVNIASDQTVPVTVSNFPATQPVSGTVAATQSGTWNITNVSGTVSLPTGAATSALQTSLNAQIPTTLGQKTSANSLAVVLASDQSVVGFSEKGRSVANAPIQNLYSGTPITTASYVQLVASTTSTINYVDIFDSSGQAMILAVGAAASEVIQAYIPPGGDQIPLAIPAGSRISYKALSANATAGYLVMSFYT